MPTTNFIEGTVVTSDWLNDVNDTVYGLPDSSSGKGSKLVRFIQRLTGAVASWVEDKLSENISVEDFGAVGDGTTDDTGAFQLALAAAAAAGKSVLLPFGKTYRITSGLTLSADIVGSNLATWFSAKPAIKIDNASPITLFTGVGATKDLCGIANVVITAEQPGIHTAVFGNCYQTSFKNVYVYDMKYGFDVQGVYAYWDECYFQGNTVGIYPRYLLPSGYPSTMFSLNRVVFMQNTYGLKIENRYGAGQSEDLISLYLNGCGFEQNTNTGLYVTQRVWHGTMTNCWSEANVVHGIYITAGNFILTNQRYENDPAPVYPALNDIYNSVSAMSAQDGSAQFNIVRAYSLAAANGTGSLAYIDTQAPIRYTDEYVAGGSVYAAGSSVAQAFTDNSGSADTAVAFYRNVSAFGGGTRTSSEIHFGVTGSSLPSDSSPYAEKLLIDSLGNFMPMTAFSGVPNLGGASNKWNTVYATTGTINTSDEREKDEIVPISDAILDAWADVEWSSFKFKSAVRNKGAHARTHVGLVAQHIAKAFSDRNLDAYKLGVLCYDEWPAQYATDPDTGAEVEIRAAGSSYGVRYEEALALEAALMRRHLKRLKKNDL